MSDVRDDLLAAVDRWKQKADQCEDEAERATAELQVAYQALLDCENALGTLWPLVTIACDATTLSPSTLSRLQDIARFVLDEGKVQTSMRLARELLKGWHP